MTSSETSFSLNEMPPLPPLPPPPPPASTPPSSSSSTTSNVNSALYPSTFNMTSAAASAMYGTAYYQQYMQQYYQYMFAQQQQQHQFNSQVSPSAATPLNVNNNNSNNSSMQVTAPQTQNPNTVSSPLKNFFNYKPPRQQTNNYDASNNSEKNPLTTNTNNKPPIKFNLKFQNFPIASKSEQQPYNGDSNESSENQIVTSTPNVRKSRFDNLNNVTNQQKEFKQTSANKIETQQQQASGAEIVSNINKWPASLKNFCAKVYQHYQTITVVTEDQVTKYLQQRITDAFKIKPNLETGWETETMPNVEDIKKVAPLSNAQQQQLRHQANLNIKKMNAARAAIQFKKQSQEPNCFNYNTLNKNKTSVTSTPPIEISDSTIKKEKRKKKSRSSSSSTSRSRSNSSSSSSTSSSSSSKTTKSSNTSKSSLDSNFTSFNSMTKKGKKTNEFTPKSADANVYQNKFNNKRKLVPFDVKQVSLHGEDNESTMDHLNNIKSNSNGQFINNFNAFNNNNGGVKLTKKQRKNQAKLSKRLQQQQEQQQRFLNTTTNPNTNNDKILLSRKTFNNINQPAIKVFKSRASFRSVFDLAKEQFEMMEIDNDDKEHNKLWCIGTNQDYEKEYLRLTGPPEPHMIRPLHVLKQSLEYILNKYKRTNGYRYICDQLKAIRQDLTVQMIQNEFTIQVYETHARIALENKDRDEFNQCQNQLKNLYNLVYKSSAGSSSPSSKTMTENNMAEFIGYRLIYNMLTKSHKDINEVTKEIKLLYPSNTYLKHLLEIKNAWHLNNYIKFFRLYLLSNHLTKCLIDLFIERERKNALKIIIKSYRPSIKLESVCEMLAYESLEKCKEDLLAYKLSIQTVSSVSNPAEANNSSLVTNPNNSTKSTSSNKTQPTATVFELLLDCKSCNIQNL